MIHLDTYVFVACVIVHICVSLCCVCSCVEAYICVIHMYLYIDCMFGSGGCGDVCAYMHMKG